MKEKLVDCASKLFLEGGLDAVSMRAVGKCAGVSAMAAYKHYENKDKLWAALVDRYFFEFIEHLKQSATREKPVEQLRETGKLVYSFATTRPREYSLIFVHQRDTQLPEMSFHLDWRGGAAMQFLQNLVRQALDAGELQPCHPESLALAIWSQAHGMLSMYVTNRLWMPVDQFEELYWKALDVLMDPYLTGPRPE